MCDFHSVLGVDIGNGGYEIYHDATNSHSGMIDTIRRTPSPAPMVRRETMFEAEWDGNGCLPLPSALIRNVGQCPPQLVDKIMDHYTRLHEALNLGKHMGRDGYFRDHVKYSDVWSKAIYRGHMPDFTDVETFNGSVCVPSDHTLNAPKLKKLGHYLYIQLRERATLNAPELVVVGNNIITMFDKSKLNAPKLTSISYLCIYNGATVTLPKVKHITSRIDIEFEVKLTMSSLQDVNFIGMSAYSTLVAKKLRVMPDRRAIHVSATLVAPLLTN